MVDRFFFVKKNKNVWNVEKRADGPWMQYADHERALAEKDREIEYLQECRISAAAMDAQRIIEYQQLMEKAVQIAEAFEIIANDHGRTCIEVQQFLNSPEVQAWKEKQK